MEAHPRARWFVYVVRCADGSLYCGIATDVLRRVREHNAGSRGSRYTRARRPVLLVYMLSVPQGKAEALRQERAIKRLSKAAKERFVLSSEGIRGRYREGATDPARPDSAELDPSRSY